MRAFFSSSKSHQNTAANQLKAADEARDARQWRQAASLYRQYLSNNARDFSIWVQLGHMLKESGEFSEADDAYGKAEALRPEDSDLLLNRGHLKKIVGDFGAAASFYQRSFSLDQNANAHREMAAMAAMTSVRGTLGEREKRLPRVARDVSETAYFDAGYYKRSLERNGVSIPAGQDIVGTYVHNSDVRPESPNRLFDISYYTKRNAEARNADVHPFEHFVRSGDREAKSPSALFDSSFVTARYDTETMDAPFFHYISRAGRNVDPVNWFESEYYRVAKGLSGNFPYYHFLDHLQDDATQPNSLFARFMNERPAVGPRERAALQRGSETGGVDIIIPHFRNAVCAALSRLSLLWMLPELQDVDARIILIDDSPEDEQTSAILSQTINDVGSFVHAELVVNASNLGFVKSTNRGLEMARAAGRHALLLNSDAFMCPGALREMLAALHADPMTAFVSPRTNNATIATWPTQTELTKGWTLEDFYVAHRDAAPTMGRFEFVPMVVGFCLLVRWDILPEFGLLDEKYGSGYFEENDLIMRAAQCGYRSVLANRAYTFHIGSATFGSLTSQSTANERRFHKRFPEFSILLTDYHASVAHKMDQLSLGNVPMADHARLRPLLPGVDRRPLISIDLSHLVEFHNGTFASIKELLLAGQEAWLKRFAVRVVAPTAAAQFHGLDRIEGYEVVNQLQDSVPSALLFRYGQPFKKHEVQRLVGSAPRLCYMMLDTIAQDSSYLFSPEVEALWRFIADTADGLLFNSAFTRDQFLRRYPAASAAPNLVSHHSLSLSQYAQATDSEVSPDERMILVLGNHYRHKFVGETLTALTRALPERRFTALWDKNLVIGSCRMLRSGDIEPEVLDAIEREAAVFVIPSHYEGFGLGMFRGLALGREVYVRDSALVRELIDAAGGFENLHLYRTTADLVEQLLAKPQPSPKTQSPQIGVQDWKRSAEEIGDFFEALIAGGDRLRVARRLTVVDTL